MYEKYYKLTKTPFSSTPDPSFFYTSPSHREALAALIYGIQYRKGFIALIGEVGTGKTTVLRSYIHSRYAKNVKTIYVFNPKLSYDDLLTVILREFTNDIPESEVKKADLLHRYLVAYYEKGVNVVIVIDEAQNMPRDTLESMRMLSNIETTRHKLIQIILAGQPELADLLMSHELRQLRQRLALTVRLKPLTDEESLAYIEHRVAKAGGSGALFTEDALQWIVKNSGGIPRKINTICDNALVSGFGADLYPIGVGLLHEIATDLRLHGVEPRVDREDPIIGGADQSSSTQAQSALTNGDGRGSRPNGSHADYENSIALQPNSPDVNNGVDDQIAKQESLDASLRVAERKFLKDAKKAFEAKHGVADEAQYGGMDHDDRVFVSNGDSATDGEGKRPLLAPDQADTTVIDARSRATGAQAQEVNGQTVPESRGRERHTPGDEDAGTGATVTWTASHSQHEADETKRQPRQEDTETSAGAAISGIQTRAELERNESEHRSRLEAESPPDREPATSRSTRAQSPRPIAQIMDNLRKTPPRPDRGPRKFW